MAIRLLSDLSTSNDKCADLKAENKHFKMRATDWLACTVGHIGQRKRGSARLFQSTRLQFTSVSAESTAHFLSGHSAS